MVGLLCSSIAIKNSFGCMVGAVSVSGQVCNDDSNVQVMQPRVVQQVGASCGYHALLNAKILYEMLFKGGEDRFLNEQIINVSFASADAPWKTFVIDKDRKYANGDWLEAEVVDKLVQKFFPELGAHFAILDNRQVFFDEKNAHCGTSKEERETFWKTLKNQLAPGFFFVFFLNNQTVTTKSLGAVGGHWIVLCLYVDAVGRHIYYVMDSLNKRRCDEPAVTRIIDSIETDRFFIPDDIVETSVYDFSMTGLIEEDGQPSLFLQRIKEGFNGVKKYIMTYLRPDTKKDTNNSLMVPVDFDKKGGKRGLGILQEIQKNKPLNPVQLQNGVAITETLQQEEVQNDAATSQTLQDEEDPELVEAYKNSLKEMHYKVVVDQEDADLHEAVQLSLITATPSLDTDQERLSTPALTEEDISFIARLKKALKKSYNLFE